ncbi:hypothetical protein LTR56_022402 [Elasticomyces elasticus]|nr:hypothetical protein LTR56_022402 [Elasticomyces elasticus]KAK3633189.1 hypothetical protein LTR22_020265 [Elasticomyces elasticus]KAK4922376.1 hypothetical protein LTR49_010241 [Elasticomyces elasticus]KAK5765257.1 hypothetical protein LTS12_004514 [Elasticomyces elasticus]
MWYREFFGWEDLEQDQKTGNYTESCQTPRCLAVCTTSHRVSDIILAEAEGDPEHMVDGIIPSVKRWITVKDITADKGRSKITAPENALFLPRIPQMLYASSFMDHLGGISAAGLLSGDWRAFGQLQWPYGTIGTWRE